MSLAHFMTVRHWLASFQMLQCGVIFHGRDLKARLEKFRKVKTLSRRSSHQTKCQPECTGSGIGQQKKPARTLSAPVCNSN